MKRLRLGSRIRKVLQGSSRGFSLIEVVIAITLIGIIGVAILGSLSYASMVLITNKGRATAESLARTQMEFIKEQKYIDYSKELTDREPDFYEQISIPSEVGDYTIEIKTEPIDPDNHQPYPIKNGNPDVYQFDCGIQKITVTVTYYVVSPDPANRMVKKQYTLEDYKRSTGT